MSFDKSLKTYMKHYDAAILFGMPLLLSMILLVLFPYPTFTSLGAVFLRVINLSDLGVLGIGITALILLVSILLIGITISAISLIVKEERVGHKTRYSLFLEAINTYSISISVFYLAVFLLLAGIQILTFIWDINTVLFSIVSLAISYLVFFVPFAMVIDDYSVGRAMTAAMEHLRAKPFDPLKWFFIIMIVNLAVVFILQLLMDYQLAKGIATFINGLIVLPFMIIYGAHMYVDKYPMTRR
ncbi:MAG: hypothetical protein NTY68_01530 [Candidatus Micrarchaeota archaeon]|nr:hypothetical protein [Candidatus Micrarchaeota archaeon]